jgi:hypothetical protein
MPTLIKSIIFVFATILLSGCETLYGVHRTYSFDAELPLSCIENELKNMPRVTDVKYEQSQGGQPITLHGIEKPDVYHFFSYTYENLPASLGFVIDYTKRVVYKNSYQWWNRAPPQEHIDKIRPFMNSFQEALESRCGIIGIQSGTKEQCRGVKC